MKNLSYAIQRIGTESAFAVGPQITEAEKRGYNIIKLNIGEPGCNIDEAATRAALNSFKNHETHYTPSAGLQSLRQAIAEYLKATRKINYQAEDIVLMPGGKAVIAASLIVLVNPGDEVVYFTPCYPIFESIISFIGAKPKPILLKEKNFFSFEIRELERALSKKTKLLILNSPSNPTGGVISKDKLKAIAYLAKKYDFYILSDEIYSRIVYGEEFEKITYQKKLLPIAPSIASFPQMAQRTIVLDGFSKTYAMTGLRLGYSAVKNQKIASKLITFAINFWSCLPLPCMRAAEAVLKGNQNQAQREITLYEQKRDFLVKSINEINGCHCLSPKGAFYLFVNVTQACKKLGLKNAEALRKYLLTYDKKNKKGVAVLTRDHFGKRLAKEKEHYIRISFAGPLADLKEGAKRIKEALEKK